jgi:hypothetical protein
MWSQLKLALIHSHWRFTRQHLKQVVTNNPTNPLFFTRPGHTLGSTHRKLRMP